MRVPPFLRSRRNLTILATTVLGVAALVVAVETNDGPQARVGNVTAGVRVDTHVQQTNPTSNYGSSVTMTVTADRTTAKRYAYVKADVPNVPPGDTHDGSTLRVYVSTTVNGATLTADRVTNDWTEGGMTWNTQPPILTSGVGSVALTSAVGWYAIPLSGVTPGSVASFRIRSSSAGTAAVSTQENTNGNDPELVLDTTTPTDPSVQNPAAVRRATDCGLIDVTYSTGANDNASSTFVTTLDGVPVDTEDVTAPDGTGGHSQALAEDYDDGSVSVVVTANGAQLLAFEVVTNCVTPLSEKVVGMSSPAPDWDLRLSQVGATGINARRIFADLTNDGRSQSNLITRAISDGMIPVVSYKGTPTSANVTAVGTYLQSLNTTVLAVYHHEPYGDMTGPEFVTRSRLFLQAVQSLNVKVGPFLNGWLLDNKVADFTSYTTPDLIRDWDFMGIDTYEAGTITSPGNTKPADRVPLLAKFLNDTGFPDEPVVIGEYNGYSAQTIRDAGEAFMSMPNVWIFCMWNSTTGKGHVLEGERLAAFKATKADARVQQ